MNMTMKCLSLWALSALGLVSCSVVGIDNDQNASYDTNQVANYQIQGSVSDEGGTPIPGIRVIADYSTDVVYRADTLYTDKEGQFSKFLSVPRVDRFFMTFSDLDGVYEPKYENVVPVRTEISSGHFGGSYIVSIDVSLKRK